jgi:hypothetical protein
MCMHMCIIACACACACTTVKVHTTHRVTEITPTSDHYAPTHHTPRSPPVLAASRVWSLQLEYSYSVCLALAHGPWLRALAWRWRWGRVALSRARLPRLPLALSAVSAPLPRRLRRGALRRSRLVEALVPRAARARRGDVPRCRHKLDTVCARGERRRRRERCVCRETIQRYTGTRYG